MLIGAIGSIASENIFMLHVMVCRAVQLRQLPIFYGWWTWGTFLPEICGPLSKLGKCGVGQQRLTLFLALGGKAQQR